MIKLFVAGGPLWMSILTLELIAVLLAAWKAPAWVREAGLIALATGLLGTMVGLYGAGVSIHQAGDVAQGLLWLGISIALLTTIYGILIYLVSLVIRIVQKPRLF